MSDYSNPDAYRELHAAIRTTEDGVRYPRNYRIDELDRAVAARKRPGRQLDWVERGPANVPGRVRAVIVDPDDPFHQTWLVGSVSGGLWKTTDAGDSWQALTEHLPNLAVTALAMADSDRDVIYMGTGEGFGNLGGVDGSGIFKTMDRGATWTQLASTAYDPAFRWVNRMAVDPSDPSVLVAATNRGLFRSSDGGSTWDTTYVHEDARPVQDLRARPDNFNIQFATVYGTAVLRSADAGRTWQTSMDQFVVGGGRMELAIAPSNPNVVYVSADGTTDSGLYRTTDGGDTWNAILNSGGTTHWLGTQGFYDQTLAVHPFDVDHVFLGGIQFWEATIEPGTSEVRILSRFEEVNTDSLIDFVRFSGGTFFERRVATGATEDQVSDVTAEDYVSVEIRFGPGQSQMAHRFTISPTGGAAGDGGAGIALADYIYADYVEIPFEVWDIDNNVQLAVSFRDQAGDGKFNLLEEVTSGDYDAQSREYIFIHTYAYSEAGARSEVAADGGLVNQMLYFMWPHLVEGGTWNPANIPESLLRITADNITAMQRSTSVHPGSFAMHVDYHNIITIPVDETGGDFMMLTANDGGVHFSDDRDNQFTGIGRGFNTAQFYGVDKRPGFDQYIGGTQDNGTWRSFNRPHARQGWLKTPVQADGFQAVWHKENDQLILFSMQNNGVFRTDNQGRSWQLSVEGLNDVGSTGNNRGPFVTKFANSGDRPDRVFVYGSSGIWRSSDFGLNWELYGVEPQDWAFTSLGGLEVALANPDEVWAGFRLDDTPPLRGFLHVSTDGGDTYSQTAVPDFAPQTRISGLATHPNADSTAFVLFSAYSRPKILLTTDLGQTWTDLSGFEDRMPTSSNGFPNVAVYDLLVMPHEPNVIWAGTEIGIFVSEDAGATWQYSDSGLPAVSVWEMKIVDTQLVVATHGRGVWTLDLPEAVEVGQEDEVPAHFQLHQNYPNPFNPATTITFEAPVASRVRIQVYDMAGRLVATIVDREYSAGLHNVEWDASRQASGVYHYRMEAAGSVQTRSMTLIK